MPALVVFAAVLVLTGTTEWWLGSRYASSTTVPERSRLSDDFVRLCFVLALTGPVLQALVGQRVPSLLLTVVGGAIALGGVLLRAVAMVQLRGRYRMSPLQQPDHPFLVGEGCYALVRHPGYLGLTAIGVGTALSVGGPLALVWAVPLAFAFVARIRWEETLLGAEFAQSFVDYRTRVRWKLVPHVY